MADQSTISPYESPKSELNKTSLVAPSEATVSMTLLRQSGQIYVGPGAKREAHLVGLGLPKLEESQMYDLERAKRYAMDQSTKHVLIKQQIVHQEKQKQVAMYTQALAMMSRVYVGSISTSVHDEQLKQYFGVFGAVKSINMTYEPLTGIHKGFAFVEYEAPEAAILACEAMNNKFLGGRSMKVTSVARPANMPQAQPFIDKIMQDARQYHRIYMSNIHPELNEQDIKEVFESFGEIKNLILIRQPGKAEHKGFGYIEFTNEHACVEAINGMNGFDFGGRQLRICRCITPPESLKYNLPSAPAYRNEYVVETDSLEQEKRAAAKRIYQLKKLGIDIRSLSK